MYEIYVIYALISIGILYGYLINFGKINKNSLTVSAIMVGLVSAMIVAIIMDGGDLVSIISKFVSVATFVGFLILLFLIGVLVPLTASRLADYTFEKLKSKSNTGELNEHN
ncbi:MAG: hypothetical protein OIN86_04735 [Candidatus Methanoperedens sp.]|nr:hypothetical protein [Candidatus Methanoperedens sp.]CAG0996989.1 hypothetical protein METP1_02631 [Methanosarcinales archaeon]